MDDHPPRKCLKIGVTGGLGSGKSLFCSELSKLGAVLFNADDEAKQILADDDTVRRAISKYFGEDVYSSSGELRKNLLAGRAFSTPENTAKINNIIHPKVYRRFEERANLAGENGALAIVIEAALIFESGYEKRLDMVVAIIASEARRIQRSLQKGMKKEDVYSRIRRQANQEQLRKLATVCIENNGLPQELVAKARHFWRETMPNHHISS